MASSHRVHIGPMAREIHEKMGLVPDIDHCWNIIREHVGKLMFGRAYVTVPFITRADYFTQMSVFTKKRKFVDVLLRRPPAYTIVGNMEYLLDRDHSTWFPQFDFSSWDVADSHSMHSDYRFRLTATPNSDINKLIELAVRKPRARSVQLPSHDTVVLKLGSLTANVGSIRHIYLITEVVFASYVHLLVRIGEDHKFVKFDRDVPIGFCYRKYRLLSDGTLGRELETELRYNDRQARWVPPKAQPMPRPPLRDRIKTGRRNRTVLTVSSQDADRRQQTSVTPVQRVRGQVQPPDDQAADEAPPPLPAPRYEIRNNGVRLSYIYRPGVRVQRRNPTRPPPVQFGSSDEEANDNDDPIRRRNPSEENIDL